MLRALLALGAAVVVAGAAGAYALGSAGVAAGAAESNANAALESVGSHSDAIGASLDAGGLDTPGSPPDYATARRAANDFVTRIAAALATVAADQARLRSARAHLDTQSAGALALPYRPGLDHQRARVGAMISALDAAGAALAIEQDQMRTLAALFDALSDLAVLTTREQQGDLAGSLAVFPGLDAKLEAAARLAQSPSNPPQLQKVLAGLLATSADLHEFLQAVQRNDRVAADSIQPLLDADASAVGSFDQADMAAYEQTLLQPYRDRYESGARAAGFSVKY